MTKHFTDLARSTEFRLADLGDVDALVELGRQLFNESGYPSPAVQFSEENARHWLERAIGDGVYPHIVAVESNRLVGSISYTLNSSVTTRPMAMVDKFYVLPSHRLSSIGRLLLQMAIEAAKADGAVAMRIFITAGISGGAANLFRKFGFEENPHSVQLRKDL